MNLFKRMTALLLCLCLFAPCLASADNARAVSFTLAAEIHPAAYPAQDQPLMEGLKDLIGMIDLEGTFQYDDDCMDLSFDLLMDGDEDTRTDVRLYGTESTWAAQSSLLGDEQVIFHLTALLEFCMKAYFHLEVPLQRIGLVVTPYVHTDGWRTLVNLWKPVMETEEGSRVIPRENVLALMRSIAAEAEVDRAFTYWVMATATESGYDESIRAVMSTLPEWADSFLGEEGVTITVDGDNQTWTTGGVTLFTQTVQDGWTTLSLSLPVSPDGYLVSAFLSLKDNDITCNLDARLDITLEDESILDLRLNADNLPQVIPASSPFSLTWDVTGDAVPEGYHIRFDGQSDNGAFTLHQLDAATGETMLTLTGTALPAQVTSPLNWQNADLTGTAFFSVSDVTLSNFVASVMKPMIKGMLPLLVKAPIEACQALMDLVCDKGIFDLLTSSSTSVDVADEESFTMDESDYEGADEEFSEEDFSEEDFEEEFEGEFEEDDSGFFDETGDNVDWEDESLYEDSSSSGRKATFDETGEGIDWDDDSLWE